MDLPLYTRILWRYRVVLIAGLGVAILLSVLSFYRITPDGVVPKLTPRKAEIWQSQANVFLTEKGFPAGSQAQYANAARFTGLATLYARLAQSDEVKRLLEKERPLPGLFQAVPANDTTAGVVPLPIISLFGKGASPSAAETTLTRGLEGFLSYVRAKQVGAGIPEKDRIQLLVLNAPEPAILIDARKKTLPVVVFLAVMIAAVALVFIFENARRGRSAALVEVFSELQQSEQPKIEPEVVPTPQAASRPQVAPGSQREQRPAGAPELKPEPAPVRRWA